MAGGGILQKAKKLLKRRQFNKVITLLRPHVLNFNQSFQFFYILGVACLYAGLVDEAEDYFTKARRLSITDENLQLAQAAIFVYHYENPNAIDYCLSVLEKNPKNKHAKKMLNLIRDYGTAENISEWKLNGKIKKFYPPLGINPKIYTIPLILLLTIALVFAGILALKNHNKISNSRADLSAYELTIDERLQATEDKGIFRYEFDEKEVVDLYQKIQKSFQKFDDNAAQIACNLILNSNASEVLKQKTKILSDYLWKPQPTFDTLDNNLTYEEVAKDPFRHSGCYVIWSGRIGNIEVFSDNVKASLLVGYDKLTNVAGFVPVIFENGIIPDVQRSVKILGRLNIQDNKLILKAIAIYQPLE